MNDNNLILVAALRAAFPQFATGAPVTADAIAEIGAEYKAMSLSPDPAQVSFRDQNGIERTLVRINRDEQIRREELAGNLRGEYYGDSYYGVPVDGMWFVGDILDRI